MSSRTTAAAWAVGATALFCGCVESGNSRLEGAIRDEDIELLGEPSVLRLVDGNYEVTGREGFEVPPSMRPAAWRLSSEADSASMTLHLVSGGEESLGCFVQPFALRGYREPTFLAVVSPNDEGPGGWLTSRMTPMLLLVQVHQNGDLHFARAESDFRETLASFPSTDPEDVRRYLAAQFTGPVVVSRRLRGD